MRNFFKENLKVGVLKYKRFFNLRAREFHFTKYKKNFFLSKYKKFVNLRAKKFQFMKYKKNFF